MDESTRRELIERYRDGYGEVRRALDGCTAEELDRRPAPGAWTAREIVHHLGDSEMTSAIRLRRLIAEDGPLIQGYDQEEYARRLFYDRPIEASLAAFRAARESTAEILDRLTAEQWQRAWDPLGIGRLRCDAGGCRSTRPTRTTTPTRSAARGSPKQP